jgi:hypothetical protein
MASRVCFTFLVRIMKRFVISCVNLTFFFSRHDTGRHCPISVDAKILIDLRYISYGVAINSFSDYFQMGESTSRLCLLHSTRGVLSSDDIHNNYFCKISKADALWGEKRRCIMNHDAHGMAFSLDCTHFWGVNILCNVTVNKKERRVD